MAQFEAHIEESDNPALVIHYSSGTSTAVGTYPLKDYVPELMKLTPEERANFSVGKSISCIIWHKGGGILWIDFGRNPLPCIEFMKIETYRR